MSTSSYTAPYTGLRDDAGARAESRRCAAYRPQVWRERNGAPAFAPRMSLILPTGSIGKGTGEGLRAPNQRGFSKIVSARAAPHANAGLTISSMSMVLACLAPAWAAVLFALSHVSLSGC